VEVDLLTLHSSDIEQWSDTDMVFSQFFKACVEAPEHCALARSHNGTAQELEATAWRILEQLKYRPIPWQGGILDSANAKIMIRPSLYAPARYPALAKLFDALFAMDLDRIAVEYANVQALAPTILSSGTGDDASFGIHCADKKMRFDNIDDVLPTVDELTQTSRLMGDLASTFPMTCAQWKFASKERYEGSFTGLNTRVPMLVIGNTFDPATPFRSAQNVSAGFENSVLLQHDGYGVSDPACKLFSRNEVF
jgi:hypothetical protein